MRGLSESVMEGVLLGLMIRREVVVGGGMVAGEVGRWRLFCCGGMDGGGGEYGAFEGLDTGAG